MADEKLIGFYANEEERGQIEKAIKKVGVEIGMRKVNRSMALNYIINKYNQL